MNRKGQLLFLLTSISAINGKTGDCLQKVNNNTILTSLDLNFALLIGFPCKGVPTVPIDVSNGRVDCDAWTTIIGPQHVWWENVVIVHNRLSVSLTRIN